ncbi:hypothetical protein P152DRAFT_80324 [Eremomyces bilateralis CBS 781.70]|uniref:Survival motor neuron Tudor domain-containing protein n=1 Tax=Eremomyces bilateralis CBS 781.70 TaxID=1392243 RepID=A0A6G1FZZ6_9PEZI|nr:uncharacterized protein P152DRAFT_80324 [Eremomyces bilateralis CBS 781.70]KAF1811139.1 hypothetical protein P152DRAFT_80324 [Eremomyces bilateralis CBS 781.70]
MTSIDLANDDTWDDTELQRSWNSAFAEYQKYHSIAAKGDDSEEILKEYDLKEMQERLQALQGNEDKVSESDQPLNEMPVKAEEEEMVASGQRDAQVEHVNGTTGQPDTFTLKDATAATNSVGPASGTMSLPNISDQNVKQMLMSWYWAGYYTGLYEGQQQASKAGELKQSDAPGADQGPTNGG